MVEWGHMDSRTENILTVGITAALILGLYAMSQSWWSLTGLALLGNINNSTSK